MFLFFFASNLAFFAWNYAKIRARYATSCRIAGDHSCLPV